MTFTMNASTAALARLFPETVDIERRTVSQDDEGGIEESWSSLFADIASQFASQSSPGGPDSEDRNSDGEFVRTVEQVILQGDYEISEEDRCLTRGNTYDVVGVQRDSYALVTVLHLERRIAGEESS